jgi:succinate dehydrogenase/fumarate reductase cytochrome b subunit
VQSNDLKGSGHVGLPCGICGGLGHAEPKTERINKRMQPILAIVTLYFLMAAILVSATVKSPYFSEILAFASPLIGVVLAFYFSARSSTRP